MVIFVFFCSIETADFLTGAAVLTPFDPHILTALRGAFQTPSLKIVWTATSFGHDN